MKKVRATGFLSAVDRRLEGRHDVRVEAKGQPVYQWEDGDGEPMLVTDVSFGGCLTRTTKFIPPQRVIINLPILGERRVELRWAKGRKVGCRFTEPLTRDELRKVVEAGKAQPGQSQG